MPRPSHHLPFRGATRVVQRTIRAAHVRLLDRGLPPKVGVYFHHLQEADYDGLRALVAFFRTNGYRVADGPDDFLRDPRERTLWLSFDDNFRGWYEALPLFEALGVRATFYVNTAFFRDRAAPETIRAYLEAIDGAEAGPTLSTGELRALRAAGHVIGAHTHTHPVLSDLPLEEAVAEIRRSKEALEALLGEPVRHFAFPFGLRRYFSDALAARCRSLGFATVARAAPALQHAGQGPFFLQRSPWDCRRPLARNVRDLSIDGRLFERLTGRSAVG